MSYLSASGYLLLSVSPHYRRVLGQLVFSWLRPPVFPWPSLAARFPWMSALSIANLCRVLRLAPVVLGTPQRTASTTFGLSVRRCCRSAAHPGFIVRASWRRSAWVVGASSVAVRSRRLAFSLRGFRGFALTHPVPFWSFLFPSAPAPNGRFEGTAGKRCLPVPRGLRPRAAPQAKR
jgi:hypothetical protein